MQTKVPKWGMPLWNYNKCIYPYLLHYFQFKCYPVYHYFVFFMEKNCIYSYLKLQVTARNPSITRNETPEYPISPRTRANTTFGHSMQRERTEPNHASSEDFGSDHNEWQQKIVNMYIGAWTDSDILVPCSRVILYSMCKAMMNWFWYLSAICSSHTIIHV